MASCKMYMYFTSKKKVLNSQQKKKVLRTQLKKKTLGSKPGPPPLGIKWDAPNVKNDVIASKLSLKSTS